MFDKESIAVLAPERHVVEADQHGLSELRPLSLSIETDFSDSTSGKNKRHSKRRGSNFDMSEVYQTSRDSNEERMFSVTNI